MESIEKIREKINQIDIEITKLYEQRMHLIEEVAEYKIKNNKPIYDEAREQEIIKKRSTQINNEELKPYFEQFIQYLMDQGKSLQQKIIMQKPEK